MVSELRSLKSVVVKATSVTRCASKITREDYSQVFLDLNIILDRAKDSKLEEALIRGRASPWFH